MQHKVLAMMIFTIFLGISGGISWHAAEGQGLPSSTVLNLQLGQGVRFVGRLETGKYTWIKSVSASANGKEVAAVSNWGEVHVWDVESLRLVRKFSHFDASPSREGAQHGIGAATFSRDGKYVCMESISPVSIWQVATGELVGKYQNEAAAICAIAINDDGKQVALAGFASGDNYKDLGIVILWDWGKKAVKSFKPLNTERVAAVDFLPNGDRLAINSRLVVNDPAKLPRWRLSLWSTITLKLDYELPFDGFGDNTCYFDPKGKYLGAECEVPTGLGTMHMLRFWDIGARKPFRDAAWSQMYTYSPILPAVVVPGDHHKLMLVDYTNSSAHLLVEFNQKDELPTAVRFSTDGRLLLVGTVLGNIYLFHVDNETYE
jgi:WD40 repeat protein